MFRSLHVRNYRWFAAGQLVSLTGTWMQRVAQDWLVLQLTNSGLALGIVTAIQFLPPVLFGMWGGMIADRGDKRRLLLMTQTGLAVAALCLGVLDVAGVVQLWQVYVLAGVVGVITVARHSHPPVLRGGDGRPGGLCRTRSGSTRRSSTPAASSVRQSPA